MKIHLTTPTLSAGCPDVPWLRHSPEVEIILPPMEEVWVLDPDDPKGNECGICITRTEEGYSLYLDGWMLVPRGGIGVFFDLVRRGG